MTAQEPITPELQAKIDALPEGRVKKRVLRALTGPGIRTASNEEIFELIMRTAVEAEAQSAQWRQWRRNEVLEFVEYFKQEMPDDYAEFLRQEDENSQIDDDLWWRIERLADRWIPGLDSVDYGNLLTEVRRYLRAQLTAQDTRQ